MSLWRVLRNCLVEKQERCFYKVRISNVNLCVCCRLVINLKLKEESSTAGNKVEHGVVKNQRKACNCKSLLPRGVKATDLANRTFDLFKVGSILQ